MKTDFNFNVQVNLGVNPELFQLVSAIMSQMPNKVQSGEALPTTHAQVEVEKKSEDATIQAPAEPNEADTQDDAPKQLTEEDVRAAMHKTRQRIEGEDYKEHTDSEAYKKYHKALTTQFLSIATFLGANKPSALPAEKRAAFIKECDALQILPDGTVGNP